MSFLLRCPQCGPRDVYEFRWGGEQSRRPEPGSPLETWSRYLYLRNNEAGPQREWWYHRSGCRRWFLGERDTRSNEVARTFWPPSSDGGSPPGSLRSPALPVEGRAEETQE
jgi:heterotetrameric sarcosine oxidase delta subunit